jgi:hypothetical protein
MAVGCTPYGIVHQERITLGLHNGQCRRPNHEVRLPLREPQLLPNLALSPSLIALRCVYLAVYVPLFISFSISGNSKPGQDRSKWQAVRNRHDLERIRKPRTAVTAHPVGLSLQCEHATEVKVVTPKQEIKDSSEDRHRLSFVSFMQTLRSRLPLQTSTVSSLVNELAQETKPTPLIRNRTQPCVLQGADHFGHLPKPLILCVIPAFRPPAVLTARGHCRNAGTDR